MTLLSSTKYSKRYVFGRLNDAGLNLKARNVRCFVGLLNIFSTDSKKIGVIKMMKATANVSELCSCLDICG